MTKKSLESTRKWYRARLARAKAENVALRVHAAALARRLTGEDALAVRAERNKAAGVRAADQKTRDLRWECDSLAVQVRELRAQIDRMNRAWLAKTGKPVPPSVTDPQPAYNPSSPVDRALL